MLSYECSDVVDRYHSQFEQGERGHNGLGANLSTSIQPLPNVKNCKVRPQSLKTARLTLRHGQADALISSGEEAPLRAERVSPHD